MSQVLSNDGPRVRRLEHLLSAELGITDLAVCGSGTTALQLACSALELTGEVLVPAATFPAVPEAVLRAGCTPVAVDVEETYLTVDPAAVQAAITPRTCAILAVHTFGCPADVEALESVAQAAGIPLIFDGAPCWGVAYRDRPLLGYGDVSTLSLHATKLIHAIEGGAVMSTRHRIADSVRRLRNFGIGPDGALPSGTNARMSELHAAVGAVVLREARGEIARRLHVRSLYREALEDLPWLEPYEFRPLAGPNVAAMPVVLAPDAPASAETVCEELLKHRIHARAYFAGRYRPHSIPVFGAVPNAEMAARRVVCLPFWGGLRELDISRIVGALTAIEGHLPAIVRSA